MVYSLNYTLNESIVVVIETHYSIDLVAVQSILLRASMNYYIFFQIHCKLSKFMIRYMTFKTKLISLVDTKGPTGNALLQILH